MLRHLEKYLSHLQLTERRILGLYAHRFPAAPELLLMEFRRDLADLDRDIGRVVGSGLADRQRQLEQLLLQPRRKTGDHAKVEQGDPAVHGNEDIAGMRIGVKEAVDEDLLHVGPKQ